MTGGRTVRRVLAAPLAVPLTVSLAIGALAAPASAVPQSDTGLAPGVGTAGGPRFEEVEPLVRLLCDHADELPE